MKSENIVILIAITIAPRAHYMTRASKGSKDVAAACARNFLSSGLLC
jgi:hypothetical protein